MALSCSTYANETDAVGEEKFSGFPIQLGGTGMKTDWKQGLAVSARMRSSALYVTAISSSLLGTWRSCAQVHPFAGTSVDGPLKGLHSGPLMLLIMSGGYVPESV